MNLGSDSGGGSVFNGLIDEVRISNTARSPSWILTEYNNQNNPSTFYTIGSEQGGGGSSPVPLVDALFFCSD